MEEGFLSDFHTAADRRQDRSVVMEKKESDSRTFRQQLQLYR